MTQVRYQKVPDAPTMGGMEVATFWRKCSTCKQPIGFRQAYQKCNVSTCNQSRIALVFCTVSCWSAHVPVYRHKSAWAVEETSPSREEWEKSGDGVKPATIVRPAATVPASPSSMASTPSASTSSAAGGGLALSPPTEHAHEILVVASKLKGYIRERSDMNTSAEVLETLSAKLRVLCDEAIRRAHADGRKTVMSRDF